MSEKVNELSVNWATLWEALADERPDDVAVVLGDAEIKWGQLDQRSAQLATVFSQCGVDCHLCIQNSCVHQLFD